MRNNNKKKNRIMLLLLILLGISVGFAALATTLKINGTANITKNTWNVHWDDTPANIHVTEGSVTDTKPTVGKETGTEDPEKSLVSWSADLNLPGDFYEFTVDLLNEGTIDAMISNIESRINGDLIPNDPEEESPLPKYIKYSVTYADGQKLEKDHLLPKADASTTPATPTRETYKVRIEYTDNIDSSDLDKIPQAGRKLNFTFRLAHVQATEDAKDRKAKVTCPGPECVYAVPTTPWTFGEDGTVLTSDQYYTDYNELTEEKENPTFAAMILDEGRIDRAFLCEKVGNTAYCFEGSRGVEFGGTEEHILETQSENIAKLKEYYPALTGVAFAPEYIEVRDEYSAIMHKEDESYVEYTERGDGQEASLYYNQAGWGPHSVLTSIYNETTGSYEGTTGENRSMVVSVSTTKVTWDEYGHTSILSKTECIMIGSGLFACQYRHQ